MSLKIRNSNLETRNKSEIQILNVQNVGINKLSLWIKIKYLESCNVHRSVSYVV
ncbi:hypothetical protein D1BOALGB6SA_7212 [Olavius sp. associated proteobacterium Delta 1]|nr:hypothetical protein D1BOALGB6SA_7212 [Olavius sp. associated proteobacterium Delta 1]